MTLSDDKLVISEKAADETVEGDVPELADLVAYLDGELDDPSVEAMERRLIAEAPLRQHAEQLDRTWQLLESLEEVSASGEFRQKTLASMAVTSATQPSAEEVAPRPMPIRWKRSVVCFAVALSVSAAGIGAAKWRLTRARSAADVELLQNLELLENYNRYEGVRNLAFLEKLAAESSDRTPSSQLKPNAE